MSVQPSDLRAGREPSDELRGVRRTTNASEGPYAFPPTLLHHCEAGETIPTERLPLARGCTEELARRCILRSRTSWLVPYPPPRVHAGHPSTLAWELCARALQAWTAAARPTAQGTVHTGGHFHQDLLPMQMKPRRNLQALPARVRLCLRKALR